MGGVDRVRFAIAIAILALAASCGGAQRPSGPRADVHLVVLDIKHAGEAVRATVVDILAERYDVVDDGEYRRTASEMGARTMRARHVAKVTKRLGLDAVAYGVLIGEKERKTRTLRLTVREGGTGKLLSRFTLPVKRGRISRTKLSKKLIAVLDQIAPDPEDAAPERDEDEIADEEMAEDDPRARTPEPADEESFDEPVERASKRGGDGDEDARRPPPARPRKSSARRRAPAEDPEIDEEPDAPPLPDVKVDEDGQAIDDELPPGLK